jgi:glycolate oxidase FAD binding subunit
MGGPAVDGVVPTWTVRPASIDDVSAVVREGAPLIATGLGGHLDMGAPPSPFDVLLRLDRLDAVLTHEAADMTVTVQAGCPLVRLEETLAAAGQWLPLDPPRPDVTSVGGLIAANLSGPLRASQGTVRDLLLGIRVVGAGGTVIAGGGRVVKNVAGYDLPKLHVGAFGTAGVIVEATFKVKPRPERESAVTVTCPTLADAAELALAVRDVVDPLWIEIAGPGVLADAPVVAVGAGGIPAEVEAASATTAGLARARGWHAVVLVDGPAPRLRLGAFASTPDLAVLRAATLPSEVGAIMERLQCAAPALRQVAHAANGVVRAAVSDLDAVAPLVAALRPVLEAGGGAFVVERAPAVVKRDLDVWGDPGRGRALMARVRQTFDPAGIFSPGRFVV